MELQDILYEKRGPAAWITLNRPTVLNALSPALVRSLRQACTDAQADTQVRAVVFTGAGRGFCAGADISTMEHTRLDDFRTFLNELATTWSLIRTLPKPTIAAINGVVVGAGFELTLVCDFRIAASTARIGSAEVNINQPMTNGSTHILPRLVGETKAKELGMTGNIIEAAEAERIGLLNACVQPDALEEHVRTLVDTLVSRGPIAVSQVKQCFARNRDVDIETAIMGENEAATECFLSADQQEGLRAFREKRAPNWSGT